MDIVLYNVAGNPIIVPDRPLEPPPGWYDSQDDDLEEETEDDGIDLDEGYVFRFGGKSNA